MTIIATNSIYFNELLKNYVFYEFYVLFVIFILVGNNEIIKKGIIITNGIFSRRGQFLREFD